jgi:hypothetical protein
MLNQTNFPTKFIESGRKRKDKQNILLHELHRIMSHFFTTNVHHIGSNNFLVVWQRVRGCGQVFHDVCAAHGGRFRTSRPEKKRLVSSPHKISRSTNSLKHCNSARRF